MPRALTNGRTGGFASPSATQPLLFSNVVGSRPYPRERFPRPYPDASSTIVPAAAPAVVNVAAADTALAMGTTNVAAIVGRAASDAALTVTVVSLLAAATRAVPDTALSVGDSAAPRVTYAPAITQAALAISENATAAISRPVATTGLTVGDIAAPLTVARTVASTAAALTDAAAATTSRFVADTALSASSVLGVSGPARTISDTALAVSAPTIALRITHPPTDASALAISETITRKAGRTTLDNALDGSLTPSDSLAPSDTLAPSAGITDALASSVTHSATARAAADTALSISPSVATSTGRSIAATALTVGDSPAAAPVRVRAASDALPGIADGLTRRVVRLISQTALTVAPAVRAAPNRAVADVGVGGLPLLPGLAPSDVLVPSESLAPDTPTQPPGSGTTDAVTSNLPRFTADSTLAPADTVAAAASRRIATVALQITSTLALQASFIPNVRGGLTVSDRPDLAGALLLSAGRTKGLVVADAARQTLNLTAETSDDDAELAESRDDRLVLSEA